MDDFFTLITKDEKQILGAIADHAFSLGYLAKKDKTAAPGYTFSHKSIKPRILRFTLNRGNPVLKLKYYAATNYSRFFHEAIRLTIEEYDYRYTGCYGCGKCDGTQGYTYRYADGRSFFRCGTELIEITDLLNLPLNETLELFTTQHQAFLSSGDIAV